MQVEPEDFDEPDADSDFDYEESSAKKRGKAKKDPPKKTPSKVRTNCFAWKIFLILTYSYPLIFTFQSGGRGRKKQIPVNYDATDTEKPYSCESKPHHFF